MRLAKATLFTLACLLAQTTAIDRGQSAFRAKEWAVAEKWFLEALRSQPSSASANKWLGMTYAAQEKYLPAEPLFRRACEIAPADPDTCYYFGRSLYLLSRFDAALLAFEKALATAQRRGRTLLGMALTLEALNRDAEAEQRYREALAAGEKQAQVDYEKFQRKRSTHAISSPEIRFDPKDLPFTVRNGALGARHLVETMIAGVGVLDFDNDGWPDIYVANGAKLPSLNKSDASFHNALLRNNHDGTFTNIAVKAGVTGAGFSMGVAAADFDNDGRPDLFVTGVRGNRLYRNRGDGTFADVTETAGVGGDGSWSVAAAWFDYDNDGRLDLFVVRYVQWDPAKEPVCGTKEFRQYCHPREFQPLSNLLYRNLGDGRFEDVSRATGIAAHQGKGMGVAVGDYNGDGRLDIFVSNDTMPNFLFHNRGAAGFEEVGLTAGVALNENGSPVSAMGAEFGDYDNDGREDLWITALTNETFPLFRNTGKMSFVDVTLAAGVGRPSLPWSGWSNAMADFNNDGWKDLFAANGHVMDNAELSSGRKSRQPNLLLTNGRTGFVGQTLPGEAFHRGLAAADFDRDGRVDLVVTRLNEPARILWNRTEQAGNWIALALEGTTSNRDAIGAWVEVETSLGRQWNRVPAASGYGCTPSRLMNFGLGSATAATRIRVRWPSGKVQELTAPVVNRVIRVVEP